MIGLRRWARALNVLDHPWLTCPHEKRARRRNQVGCASPLAPGACRSSENCGHGGEAQMSSTWLKSAVLRYVSASAWTNLVPQYPCGLMSTPITSSKPACKRPRATPPARNQIDRDHDSVALGACEDAANRAFAWGVVERLEELPKTCRQLPRMSRRA